MSVVESELMKHFKDVKCEWKQDSSGSCQMIIPDTNQHHYEHSTERSLAEQVIQKFYGPEHFIKCVAVNHDPDIVCTIKKTNIN